MAKLKKTIFVKRRGINDIGFLFFKTMTAEHILKRILKTLFLILWATWGLMAQESSRTTPVKVEDTPPLVVEFNPYGGHFRDQVVVELNALGATSIFYTTDGKDPERGTAQKYDGPIQIDKTTVLRAIAYRGKEACQIISHTYFINEPESTFPIVSISLNPDILFDSEYGLFMKGKNAIDSLWKLPGANFWSRKELPISTEIFETNGECVYRNLTGFRLFGGMSRLFPQKSFTLVARKRYGQKRIKHKIFGEDGLKKFKFLVLRNSGSDYGKTHFRDGLMTGLLDDWDIEKQDFRPAHVYINGEYWGIYNIREKINRYFISDHNKGVDKDSIDLFEHRSLRKRGSRRHYQKLLTFLEEQELTNSTNYAYVQSMMDIENFIDYQIAQIYFDNQDAGGNIKYWRPQTPNGKWRWILYDTDWGFGLHNSENYKKNSLAFHTEPNGPSWPNPPWSTFLLRKLLENRTFERAFINRFADRLNTTFTAENVGNKIDELYADFLPEIPRHFDRWRLRKSRWEEQVDVLRTFGKERPEYVWAHLEEKFNTGSRKDLSIEVTHGGYVIINENIRIEGQFSGKYFQEVPVKLEAIPALGYRFSHWEGISIDKDENEVMLKLRRKSYQLKAVFEKFEHPLVNQIMINEVSPNNKKSGDWLEIYNNSDETVNLENWILADSKNEFLFPRAILPPKDYIIVCEDSASFESVFPHAYNYIGGLGFGLNKISETIQLFTPEGAAIDSIGYQNIEPRDSVFTLNLLLPWLNNSDFENWEMLSGQGTPNSANRYYVESTIQAERELWMQIGGAFAVVLLCVTTLFLKQSGKL